MAQRLPPTLCVARGLLLAAAVAGGGCYSGLNEGPDPGAVDDGAGPGGDDTGPPAELQCEDPEAAASPLLRLTRSEYRNTVRDLLGLPTEAPFDTEESAGPFSVNAHAAPSVTTLDNYRLEAEAIATVAVQDVAAIVPCDPAADGDADCARQFIEQFGRRAFRRPLSTDEVARYEAVYAVGSDVDFAGGIELVLAAMLQSPHFLYRVEVGTPLHEDSPDLVVLNDYEVAARLSYFLWRSTPDDDLLAAADAGELSTRDGRDAAVRRMLADDRFRDVVAQFHSEWMGLGLLDSLDKDPALFPEFDGELGERLRTETEAFSQHVFTNDDGRLATLLTAPYTFVDQTLAGLYDLPGGGGDAFERVELDGTTRGGLLTQASLLAVSAGAVEPSIVHRGKFVREALLCQSIPPPPVGADSMTEVDRLDSETCAVCHIRMDPIGEGFSHYDALGRFRTETPAGDPITAAGDVLESDDVDGAFASPLELAHRLSDSEQVRQCMTRQWFRFALGREARPADDCAMDNASERLGATDGDLTELIVSLALSDATSLRQLAPEAD